MAQVTTRISKEDRILRELRFDSMNLREAGIEIAHTKTFEWLLHDPNLDSESTHEKKSIHVSESAHESGPANNPGPPVESKPAHDSDPQKRDIEEENRVKESEMRQNARASFLEWLRLGSGIFYISGKAGSGKSTLMKFLSQHRRTRAELSHWAADKKLVFAHFFFWNSGTELQKSLEGLYRSVLFETLRECPELIQDLFPGRWKAAHDNRSFRGHKFCFFIDGLDEYAGDHWKMAKSLTTWAASLDIKICVSSRPHNEFEDSFSPNPKLRLRLHELTKVDMERFVNDEFNGDARFVRVKDKDDRYLKLVNEIVERADGVFLWVRLATRSLLTGLGNDFSISELEEKLATIPTGLNDLFRKMWDAIELSDRVRSARTFSIATLPRLEPHMLTYSFLDDLYEDPHFTSGLRDGKVRALTENEILERLERTRRRLNGRCKGLLEITENDGEDLFFRYRVGFIHRTVREFLVQDEMQKELKAGAGNFDALGSVCQSYLAQIKSVPTRAKYFCRAGGTSISYSVLFLVRSLVFGVANTEKKSSNSQFRVMEALSDLLDRHRELPFSHPHEATENTGRICWEAYSLVGGGSGFVYSFDEDEVQFSLIHLAAHSGVFSYVSRNISLSPSLLKSSNNRSLLVSASLGSRFSGSSRIKLSKFLLDQGASPNEQIPRYQINTPKPASLTWTPWNLFLLGSIDSVDRSDHPTELTELLEIFLRKDADTDVCLVGYQAKGDKREPVVLGGPYYMTLEQLIEIWAPRNAETLLQLLQHKHQKGSMNWSSWIGNSITHWKRPHLPVPECQIKRFDVDKVPDTYFAATGVASMACLGELDLSEFDAASCYTEEEGSKRLNYHRTLIRVA